MMKKRYIIGIGFVIIICLFLNVRFILDFQGSEKSNLETLFSGLWSALATGIVGFIAYLQSKNIRNESEKNRQRDIMPDFVYFLTADEYAPSSPTKPDSPYLMRININPCDEKGIITKQEQGVSLRFVTLDKPIINLSIASITVNGRKELEAKNNYGGIILPNRYFVITYTIGSRFPDLPTVPIRLCFQYQNYQRITYQKYLDFSFSKTNDRQYSIDYKTMKSSVPEVVA